MVPQGDVLALFNAVGKLLGDIERDRHRPKLPIAQAHVVHHAVVVFLSQEAFERIEAAIHQQFQIANLAWRKIPRHEVCCFAFQLLCAVIGDIKLWDGGMDLLHGW